MALVICLHFSLLATVVLVAWSELLPYGHMLSISKGQFICNNADARHGAGIKDLKMTDEKKPPQEVDFAALDSQIELAKQALLVARANLSELEAKRMAHVIAPAASIVLDINRAGEVRMRATCGGEVECSFVLMSDKRLLTYALPAQLAELRDQIRLGRRLTIAESAAIGARVRQSLSESMVTV